MKKGVKVHEEHKSKAPKEINIALVVVSTSRYEELKFEKESSDKTIPLVKRVLDKETSINLISTQIIPDSEEHLNNVLTKLMNLK